MSSFHHFYILFLYTIPISIYFSFTSLRPYPTQRAGAHPPGKKGRPLGAARHYSVQTALYSTHTAAYQSIWQHVRPKGLESSSSRSPVLTSIDTRISL